MSKTFADWFGEDLTGQTYDGDINCSHKNLTSLKGAPQKVNGRFDCEGNQLTSLEGSPQEVGKDFWCNDNQLTSLEGAPQKVSGNFVCSRNKLTSLEGAPKEVGGSFICTSNQLTSLEGAPQEVRYSFECPNNQLTSLEGSPKEVKSFYCQYNKLTSLEGAPQKVKGKFECSNNQLTSLEGSPQVVEGSFSCDKNKLTSLEGGPQEVGSDREIGYDYFDCRYNNLTSLKGAPKIVNGDFWCKGNKLTSLDGIGEVKGKIYSDFNKDSDTSLDDNLDNDDFDNDDDDYLTNDQLKVGNTYALVLDKGYDWTLSEVDDFDLTEEEIQRLKDAGWIDEYGEIVIPDQEPFVVKAKGRYGDAFYFPSVDVTFDGLVGGDDNLYYKVESKIIKENKMNRNESRTFTSESKLLRDVKKILNEEAYAAAEFIRIPNSALRYLDGIQLFTYNDPNYSDSGLFDEEFSERDDEYAQEILNGEKQHVFTIKGDNVYVNNEVPVDINYSKHSKDPHACGTIIYKNPDNFKEVYSCDLYDDPRNSVNSDDIWFQVRIADLSNDKIKELINNCEFSNVDKRSILTALSKDELIDLL